MDLLLSSNYSNVVGSPYGSTVSGGKNEIVIKVDTNYISAILCRAYQNTGSCKYVDIYYSKDNKIYKKIDKQIVFSSVLEVVKINTTIFINVFLIKENNLIYNLKNYNTQTGKLDPINESDILLNKDKIIYHGFFNLVDMGKEITDGKSGINMFNDYSIIKCIPN